MEAAITKINQRKGEGGLPSRGPTEATKTTNNNEPKAKSNKQRRSGYRTSLECENTKMQKKGGGCKRSKERLQQRNAQWKDLRSLKRRLRTTNKMIKNCSQKDIWGLAQPKLPTNLCALEAKLLRTKKERFHALRNIKYGIDNLRDITREETQNIKHNKRVMTRLILQRQGAQDKRIKWMLDRNNGNRKKEAHAKNNRDKCPYGYKLKCLTWNTRNMNEITKREQLLNSMEKKHVDIAFLQETNVNSNSAEHAKYLKTMFHLVSPPELITRIGRPQKNPSQQRQR